MMYIVDSGAFLQMMEGTFSQSAEKKTIRQTKKLLGDPNQRGEGLHSGARHLLVHGVVLRYCLWDDHAMSWCVLSRGNREGTPH